MALAGSDKRTVCLDCSIFSYFGKLNLFLASQLDWLWNETGIQHEIPNCNEGFVISLLAKLLGHSKSKGYGNGLKFSMLQLGSSTFQVSVTFSAKVGSLAGICLSRLWFSLQDSLFTM